MHELRAFHLDRVARSIDDVLMDDVFRALEILDADHSAEGYNPLCGDRVILAARVEGGRVIEVRFDGRGCALCLGAASILTEAIEGRTLDELEAFYDSWIVKLGNVVMRGYSTYAGSLPADSALSTTPWVRRPCQRIHSRLMLLADGTATPCDQDVAGRGHREPVVDPQRAGVGGRVAGVQHEAALLFDRSTEVDDLLESVQMLRPLSRPRPVTRRDLLMVPVRALRTAREEGEHTDPNVERVTIQRPLHTAIRYGVSQALLRAVALARNRSMAEVIAEEWELPMPESPIPIHAQSGQERTYNAEKMIARRIASLPHGLVDNLPEQVGRDGSELTRYIRWLARRIEELGGKDYYPTIHLDIYGALGQIYDHRPGQMLGQLYAWEMAAKPYSLRIETPVLLDSRAAQIETMATLREYARFRKMTVQLVADEWANTLDDIRAFVAAGAVVSNDVAGRRPGQGCRAALMTAKGHLRFLMRLLVEEEVVHVETERDRLDGLLRVFEHYRVATPARFRTTPRIVLGSLVAYFAGEFSNSYTLARMKVLTQGRWLWTRTIGSTLIGQAVDTILFDILFDHGLPSVRAHSHICPGYNHIG